MTKKPATNRQIETDFKQWLANGGEQEMRAAMKRAKETSDEFARSTRVRTETLYEPVSF